MQMEKSLTNDGVIIAKVMKDHLNKWAKKPSEIALEDLGKNVPSMMIQQLSSAEKKREYVNGSYIGVWSFALYIRVDGNDTASRLDAIGCLNAAAEWLMQKDATGAFSNLPTIDSGRTATRIDLASTPSIAARYADGTEDYQAIMSLEYKVRRK